MKILFINTYNMDFQLLETVKQRSDEMKKLPFRLTSLVEYGESIDGLYPDRTILQYINNPNQVLFTVFYQDYILNNPERFKIFMHLMTEAMERDYTYILVSQNQYTERALDELAGLIKDRYGIESYFINEYNDIANEIIEDKNFKTKEQRMCFIADSERYTKLMGIKQNEEDIKGAQEDREILKELYNEQFVSNGSLCSTI